jgi:hypothetical protein
MNKVQRLQLGIGGQSSCKYSYDIVIDVGAIDMNFLETTIGRWDRSLVKRVLADFGSWPMRKTSNVEFSFKYLSNATKTIYDIIDGVVVNKIKLFQPFVVAEKRRQ